MTFTLTGFSTVEARGRRADGLVHGHRERRHARRRGRGDDHRHRRDAGRGRPERAAPDRAVEGHPQRDPDRRARYNALLVLVPGLFGGQQDVSTGPVQLVHVQRARRDPVRADARTPRRACSLDGLSIAVPAGRRHELPDRHAERAGSHLHDVGQHRRSGVGGPVMNIVPRTGGNTCRATASAAGPTASCRAATTRRAAGRGPGRAEPADQAATTSAAPSAARSRRTGSGSSAPPARRAARRTSRSYYNKNAGNPNEWLYEPGSSAPGVERQDVASTAAPRLTHAGQPAQQAQPVLGRAERLQHL